MKRFVFWVWALCAAAPGFADQVIIDGVTWEYNVYSAGGTPYYDATRNLTRYVKVSSISADSLGRHGLRRPARACLPDAEWMRLRIHSF